jgi:CRP/FNR family transcriptional regulator, cyclic AMP receptor protein
MPTIRAELVATLRRVPLFAELSESELKAIANRMTRREYDAGATVFTEGDRCRELLIVETGAVRLIKTAASGREQLISIERMGSTLAEVPAFDQGKYSVTASAIETTALLRLPAEDFRDICLQRPEVAMKVIKVLGHRLRHLDGLVEELSFSTVRDRLIAHLLQLTEKGGRRTGREAEFELHENNEELAARLGTVRELISRNLGRLHGDGLIEMRRRTVLVPDVSRLEKEISGKG